VAADFEKFWEQVEQEKDRLWRLSRALTRSYDEALDLMSDTWVAAYESYPTLREPVAFRQFISTIAVRLHRRKRWRNRLFVPLEAAADLASDCTSESSYDLDILLSALARLPLREREAIVLFEISGLPLAEIHIIQGITISGVKSRLSRARRRLRTMLVDEEYNVDLGLARARSLAPASYGSFEIANMSLTP
jgi:RNA polymerase sigma-70 factor (ECF subfamily)